MAREDLGEQGMDLGAIERLGDRMRQSRAQEASVAEKADERGAERRAQVERELQRDRESERGFGIE